MKDLNCVFTRVHWPQDRRVLEFCDRHGILMQEEVPAWGPDTFSKTSDDVQHALQQNGLEQLREMVRRDCNHPCIVAWGLCNEVDGKNPRARQFARLISAEARRLDPSRLQTYASHTLGSDPGADMAGEFDFISTNEYYGSWTPGTPADVEAHIDRIRKAFPTSLSLFRSTAGANASRRSCREMRIASTIMQLPHRSLPEISGGRRRHLLRLQRLPHSRRR